MFRDRKIYTSADREMFERAGNHISRVYPLVSQEVEEFNKNNEQGWTVVQSRDIGIRFLLGAILQDTPVNKSRQHRARSALVVESPYGFDAPSAAVYVPTDDELTALGEFMSDIANSHDLDIRRLRVGARLGHTARTGSFDHNASINYRAQAYLDKFR